MRVLLVEPAYRRVTAQTKRKRSASRGNTPSDEVLWYPPLGLMKLSRFHKNRGDEVMFVYGCDKEVMGEPGLFSPGQLWDRVYITTVFTYMWDETVRTIEFYQSAVGRSRTKILVGGVMASLMPEAIFEETGIYPVTGVLHSPDEIGLQGDEDIDLLPPDYSLLDGNLYAINETYYAYTSHGCVNNCPWCGVPKVEPSYHSYIDIKPTITQLRKRYGDKPVLKLMDNNVSASAKLESIVEDLLELGYGRGCRTQSDPPRQRVIDFNQGLDASFLTEDKMKLLSQLNIAPMRIAFDRLRERDQYVQAVCLARRYGVKSLSNYMLFNWKDDPKDLYERLKVNIALNEEWREEEGGSFSGGIYSYPMRYAPIGEEDGRHANRKRDRVPPEPDPGKDFMQNPTWNRRFIRSVEIMRGAAHGAISPTPSLARRTIGESYEEFIANLFMPEALLRNRNKYEKRLYEHEPDRAAGTGDVEEFRAFVLRLLRRQGDRFWEFYRAVAANSVEHIREGLRECRDAETRKWLKFYLIR